MKTRLAILLFFWSLSVQAQQINTVEYFFDTDPGFGKASQIVLNSATLDSTFNFVVAALPTGLHTLFVRLKNSSNQWSTVYQGNIFIVNGINGAAQIIQAEYFYDTDPGIGNGNHLPLNNGSLDSLLSFSVDGLTAGAHSLFVRLQNSNHQWSTTYQDNFLVWPGTTGNSQVQSLQYFIDTVNNSLQLPLIAAANLDTTISIPVPDNGQNMRKLGLRLKNNTGETGNATLVDISLCDLYKPEGLFRSVRFGNSYTFIDQSLDNPSQKIKWMVENVADTLYNNSRIFNYTFPAGFHGYKTIQQVTGTGCRVDTVYKDVVMEGIESYSPNTHIIGNDLVLNIFGGDLDTTTQLYLQHGSSIVYPFDKTSYQNKILSAIFDFHTVQLSNPTAQYDEYDLHVHFANGYDTILVKAVTVGTLPAITGCNNMPGPQLITDHRPRCSDLIDNDQSFVTADLSGSEGIRVGTWNYYTLNVTNVGYVLVKETPVYLVIPAQYEVVFDIDWHVNPALASIPVDSLPHDYYQVIDTIVNGKVYQYKMYMLVPPFIMPGQTLPIDFKIRASQTVPDQIIYWVQKPMFGSPLRSAWLCGWDVAGYTAAGCLTSVWDFFQSHGGFPASYRSDFSHGILRGAFKDLMNGARNVVGTSISCGATTAAAAKKIGAEALKTVGFWEKKVLDRANNTWSNKVFENCRTTLDYAKEKIKKISSFFSFDPNSISGNNDYDTILHYINNYSPQHYTVNFENKPTATAKTQHVFILDTLNPGKFNLKTFRFTGYRIGDSAYVLPPARSAIFQTVNIKGDNSLKAKFVGSFDTLTGIVRCDFFSMDTSGNQLLADTSLNGFLPPNTDGSSGTGSVQFSVSAKDLNTSDTFSNKASIYFDTNAPIETNTWTNTIDTTSPGGRIVSAIVINDTTAKLVVQHSDIGSGFSYNEFYAKGPSDTAFTFFGISSSDTILFKGILNQTYQVYSVAVDNVGNRQLKNAADITLTLSIPLPLTLVSFNGTLVNDKVQLKWLTSNEINTSYFDVELSTDGNHFNRLATVKAKGNTAQTNEYISWDTHPSNGNNYYRLKQVDQDGRFTNSNIIRMYYGRDGYVLIAPNPATGFVNITGSNRFAQIQLIDVTGKLIRVFSSVPAGRYSLAGLSRGLYYLKLVGPSETKTFKLQIE